MALLVPRPTTLPFGQMYPRKRLYSEIDFPLNFHCCRNFSNFCPIRTIMGFLIKHPHYSRTWSCYAFLPASACCKRQGDQDCESVEHPRIMAD
eukprot:scaffold2299_cov131-Cylindrotheca_fusiformis.AAC.48